MDITNCADNLNVIHLGTRIQNVLANRVLTWEHSSRQFLVHNSYQRRTVDVGFAENASAEQRKAHGLEITRTTNSNVSLIIGLTTRKIESAITIAPGQR